MSRAKVASDSAGAAMAARAAERLDAAAAVGEQFDLLAAPASPANPADIVRADGKGAAGAGRPKGSANKRDSRLRQMLAARGYRMPEDVLAEMAGLSDRAGRSGMELAMARVEQIEAWSGGRTPPRERRALLVSVMREQRMAAGDLLPYGLAKMTPDTTVNIAAAQILMPGASAQGAPGDGARVIEGRAASNFAPPPLPGRTEQYQEVSADDESAPDGGSRTK